MKSKQLPKVQNILAFLQSKGWDLVGENKLYFILTPPDSIGFLEKFQYFVPLHERFIDYRKVSDMIVSGLSELYELDYKMLYNLLYQSQEEFLRSGELWKEVLAHAS